ncbi:lymphatic vessel endothelial hyaluronic receptor 1b [Clarias gariepinus]|uniref:lymphatic vessel endothelial hyaluronic receptor 1b n=1 Tax=Clarias gariepinus TaxID=13013 RepID=UPI00234C3DF7|nr:lymphatic vessel endothelial hyaluronic receptor 1b [Clarias gariepinus]
MVSSVCSVLCLLLSLVICTASLDLSQIQVYPQNGGISKVFVVQLKNQAYKFNATTAIDVCTRMGVSIATRAQVETAHHNGLETCRYGWVMEKIAVIPRIKKNPNCGKNKTGVIVWSTLPSQLFDAFCFNSTGQTEATTSTDSNMTTVSPGRTDAKTTSSSFIKSTQLNKNFIGSSLSPQPISTAFNTSVLPTTFPSTVAPMTTKSFQTSPPSSSPPSAGYQPSISSSLSTSITYTDLSLHPFIYSSSVTIFHNETDDQPLSGKRFSFGAVPIACVFLVVTLLVMAGTGTFWYFKIKQQHRLSPWERIQHKDMFETEMWRHTEDFNMQNDSRNCSDDITLQMEDEISS